MGAAYTQSLTISDQNNYQVSYLEGFKENGKPVQLQNSTYFKQYNQKYIASKAGKLDGQCMLYKESNGNYKLIDNADFSYEITASSPLKAVSDDDADKSKPNPAPNYVPNERLSVKQVS